MKYKQVAMRLFEEMFPFVVAFCSTRRFARQLALEDIIITDKRYEKWMELSNDVLDSLIEKERQRGKSIEEKTSKTTAFIAVGLTIASTFLGSILTNFGGDFKIWLGSIFGLAFCYIFIGGWIGYYGMATRANYGYGADWEVALKKQGKPKTLRVDALACWEISNKNIVVLNEAALQCIRNGFLLFFIGASLAFLQPFIAGNPSSPQNNLLNIKIITLWVT